MSNDIAILAATRTAIGSFQGTLSGLPAHALGAALIRGILEKTGIAPAEIDEVVLGQILTAGSGQNPARQAAIAAGLPHTVPALSLNKVCGSGLKAVHLAAQALAVNQELGWDTARVNVNGGAIALGHPIGASGARVLVTLIHELIRRDAHKGLATLCIGGGQGVGIAIER